MESFRKSLSKICPSTAIHVSWTNLAKIGLCEVAEKSSHVADKKNSGVEPRISAQLGAQNFVDVVGPGQDLRMCTDFGPDRLRFAGLILERVQKSQYNIAISLQ